MGEVLRRHLMNAKGYAMSSPLPPKFKLSSNLITYDHEVASIPLIEVSRESYSISLKGDPLIFIVNLAYR